MLSNTSPITCRACRLEIKPSYNEEAPQISLIALFKGESLCDNCVQNEDASDYEYTSEYSRRYRPAQGRGWNEVKCCNAWLPTPNFTNTCPTCGCDYNWNGSMLAPRHLWGEETGEHWTDCY